MNRKARKLESLVNQVRNHKVGQEQLAIWGGTCAEGTLVGFIKAWPLKYMPYRIWESTDRIKFKKEMPVPNVTLLERGRLFGKGGDLDLRRDGDEFRWRFVGDPHVRPPDGYDAEENDFWTQHPDVAFHCYEETALLWGERKGDRWHEDRVATAELDYPAPDDAERVQVQYTLYSRAGRVEFVRLSGVNQWKEDDNG